MTLCCGATWRHREKPQYRCTTTIHPVYNWSKKELGKFTSCNTFGAHKLVHSEPFLDYRYELWQMLSALYSDMQNFFLYRCTSTVAPINYCSRTYFKSLSYLYEVVRTNFYADFLDVGNFWPQFRENLTTDIWELCSASQRAIPSEKTLKTLSKSTYKRQRNAWSNYAPSKARCSGLGASPTNKEKNKHHIFAPTAGARCAIFPKLCTIIELVMPIIKGAIHFLIQRIVFPTGCTERFGLIYRRVVSQQ